MTVASIETDAAIVARLRGVIADALHAMDEGRYGDARRILKTGKAGYLKPVSSVIARDGGAA